ncbi:MAG: hypothetical protein IJV50_04905 [Lachnospiraceae bacterium]|nr:hypothetical protein [Lachnospiraceae bacterium]
MDLFFTILTIVFQLIFWCDLLYIGYCLFIKHVALKSEQKTLAICAVCLAIVFYLVYLPLALSGERSSCMILWFPSFLLYLFIQRYLTKQS